MSKTHVILSFKITLEFGYKPPFSLTVSNTRLLPIIKQSDSGVLFLSNPHRRITDFNTNVIIPLKCPDLSVLFILKTKETVQICAFAEYKTLKERGLFASTALNLLCKATKKTIGLADMFLFFQPLFFILAVRYFH